MNLDEMEALEKAATLGSWFFDHGNIHFFNDGLETSLFCHYGFKRKEDGEFIAASRNFVPFAIKRIRELEEDRRVLEDKVQKIETDKKYP